MTNVLQMLERTAEKNADRIAFADPDREISFGELERLSKKIATMFINGTSVPRVGMCEPVAFYMEKCVEAMPVMFGAVYAGGFYGFIDVRQPAERAAAVISKLSPALIVTDAENAGALKEVLEVQGSSAETVDVSELISMAEDSDADEELLA